MSLERLHPKQCYNCREPFTIGQIVYEVKLDDGTIIPAHGNCAHKIPISRIPIKKPDWWIRRLGVVRLTYEREGQ